MFKSSVIGLKIQTIAHYFVLLNVYLCCEDVSLISLHDIQSNLQGISNFICDELFDDIIVNVDFNVDPFKGRFFNHF